MLEMRRVFQKLTPKRAVPLLVVSIMAITPAVVMGVGASATQASTTSSTGVKPLLTHEGAEETARKAAKAYWGGDPIVEACYNTGVNEAKHVQWECYGRFGGETCDKWYVGVGPYGEVLQHEGYYTCGVSSKTND
jgi:hypothetical protein